MKILRIICMVVCVALVCTMMACGNRKGGSPNQESLPPAQESLGGTQSTQKVPLFSVKFSSLAKMKEYFFITEKEDNDPTENVFSHTTQDVAEKLISQMETTVFPILDTSLQGEGRSITNIQWVPERQKIEIVYVFDGVRYRLRYYFETDSVWSCEPDVPNVQVGPYTIDFERREHQTAVDFFVGGVRADDVYISLWVTSKIEGVLREDNLSFEMFEFVPLLSIDRDEIAQIRPSSAPVGAEGQ